MIHFKKIGVEWTNDKLVIDSHSMIHFKKMELKMNDEFGHWLAGFVAGEGCFCIYVPLRKKKDNPTNLLFLIKLRQDDLWILQEIKNQLNCGNIIMQPARGRSKPAAVFSVGAIADLINIIVPLFRKFPIRAKKARDFETWAQAVELFWLIQQSEYVRTESGGNSKWTDEAREKMLELKEKLKQIRQFNVPTGLLSKLQPLNDDEIEHVKQMIASDVELIDAKEAATLAGMGRQGIERAARENRIISVKIGLRRYKYPKWQFISQVPLSEILKHLGHKNKR